MEYLEMQLQTALALLPLLLRQLMHSLRSADCHRLQCMGRVDIGSHALLGVTLLAEVHVALLATEPDTEENSKSFVNRYNSLSR